MIIWLSMWECKYPITGMICKNIDEKFHFGKYFYWFFHFHFRKCLDPLGIFYAMCLKHDLKILERKEDQKPMIL